MLKLANGVANCIHKHIKKNGGAINKNLGEAFLFTFKFDADSDYNINVGVAEQALKAVVTAITALDTEGMADQVMSPLSSSLLLLPACLPQLSAL